MSKADSDWELVEMHDDYFKGQEADKTASVDDLIFPKWFREKTLYFPFTSFLFSIFLILAGGYLLSLASQTGYNRRVLETLEAEKKK